MTPLEAIEKFLKQEDTSCSVEEIKKKIAAFVAVRDDLHRINARASERTEYSEGRRKFAIRDGRRIDRDAIK